MFTHNLYKAEISIRFGRAVVRSRCGGTAEFEDADVGSIQLDVTVALYNRAWEFGCV
jgi:hypothetical protein